MTLVQDDKTEVDGQIIVENYVSDGGSVSAKAFSGNSNLHDCNTHTCPALNLGLAKSDQCKEPFSMTAVDSCCPHIECTDCAWIPCMMIDCPGDAYEFSITPVPGECCDDVQCVLRADTQPPSMTNCPANIAVTGTQGTPVSWMEPSFSDNIAVKAVTKTHEPYHEFCEGTTTVSYTATDYQDNERVCTFKVTVVDNSPPVIVWEPAVLANGTRTCDQLPIQWPSVSAVSNKGGFPSVQFSSESFTSGKTHTFIGVWTNTHAQPQAVAYTVVDNTPPTFNGVWPQPSSDLVTELEANTFINSLSGLLGFEDPCSGMGSISIQSSVNTDDIIVVARAEDSVGNVQEVQHTYSRGSADDDNDGGVGGQTDADGCIIGTGYTWCDAANDCIPQWEQSCDTTCLQHRDQSQNTVTNIAGKLVFNGAAYSQYDSIAVTQGEYEFTNIPASNPLGFVVSGGAIDVLEGTVDGEPVSQSGSLIQHYSGYLKIRVNYDFTSGGIRGRYAGYSAGGENTLVYDGSCPASTTVTPATVEKTNVCLQGMADGVNEITVVNGKYLFNGNAYCAEELMAFTAGEYYFDIPSSHPFGIVMGSGYNVLSGTPSGDPMNVDGVTVQHYIGQLYVSLNGNAGETFSYHCQYHGYMGGKDRMVYDDQSCVGSAAGGPAPPPPPSTDENGCVTDSQFYCAEYQMCLSNGVPCLNKCLRNIDQGTNALAVVGGKYQFNGEAYKSYNSIAVTTGEYKISIPSSHPFGLIVDPSVINVISGTTYGSPTTKNGVSFQHYRGTLHFEVLADFGRGGYNCAFHGYMGGNNHLAYDDTCVGAVSPDPATPEPPSPSCDSGINICWDGSVVSRSLPDCLFVCPDQVEDEDDDFITCLTDVMECPGGETLGRDPSKDCAFPDCPDTTNTGSNSYVPVHTTETVSACGGTSGTPPVKDEGKGGDSEEEEVNACVCLYASERVTLRWG